MFPRGKIMSLLTHYVSPLAEHEHFGRFKGKIYRFPNTRLFSTRTTLKRALVALPCLLLAGCGLTALQLQQATDSLRDSVPDLLSAQIFHNIIAKSIHPDALPAQVVVGAGQAQVTNQLIMPSATINFTGMAIRSMGLQNQNQWQQSWSVSAVTDVGDLQRLDSLYRYARNLSTICDFIENYTRAIISATTTTSLRISDTLDGNARVNDYAEYNEMAPSKESSTDKNATDNRNVKVKLSFGPPATLPLPPKSAVRTCHDHHNTISYSDLYPQNHACPVDTQSY
jgi:hypothetical protein